MKKRPPIGEKVRICWYVGRVAIIRLLSFDYRPLSADIHFDTEISVLTKSNRFNSSWTQALPRGHNSTLVRNISGFDYGILQCADSAGENLFSDSWSFIRDGQHCLEVILTKRASIAIFTRVILVGSAKISWRRTVRSRSYSPIDHVGDFAIPHAGELIVVSILTWPAFAVRVIRRPISSKAFGPVSSGISIRDNSYCSEPMPLPDIARITSRPIGPV
jgi:hypothetical protein